MHVDMDAFFAAVEERRNPDLKGKPLIIGGRGDPSKRGVVSTASYEARKYGIHSGMSLRTAFKLCPTAVFLPVDYKAYVAVSRQFKSVLRAVTPNMEDVGIDEAFLDLSEEADADATIADRIKAGIYEKTGLTCSIGIAPNKLLAKIASDMEKPDGVTILTEYHIKSLLWPMPIRKLYGIGPKTEEHLKKRGVETIGQLAALPVGTLVEQFGSSHGTYLYEAARGIDTRPIVTHWEPKSFSRETTFQVDVRDWQVIARTIAELTSEVVGDLDRRGFLAKTVTLKIRFNNFRTVTRACSLMKATSSEDDIRRTAFSCLKRLVLDRRVRLIGVRVTNLKQSAKSSSDDVTPCGDNSL